MTTVLGNQQMLGHLSVPMTLFSSGSRNGSLLPAIPPPVWRVFFDLPMSGYPFSPGYNAVAAVTYVTYLSHSELL